MKTFKDLTKEEQLDFVFNSSDEEFDALSASWDNFKVPKRYQPGEPAPVDKTQGMSPVELAFAGAGQRFMRPVRGVKEMLIGINGTPEEIAAYNKEKAEIARIDKNLLSNWEAASGGAGVDVLTAAALPSRLAPQVIAAAGGAAISPVEGDVGGFEATKRFANAGASAASTYGAGKALQGVGRLFGASTGQLTPQGKEAMRLDRAAKDIGVNRQIGDLDPVGSVSIFERSLPSYVSKVDEQAKAFTRAAQKTQDIPSKTGRSFEPRLLEGEKVRESIEEAGKAMKEEGSQMWATLDNYVMTHGLPEVKLPNTQQDIFRIVNSYTPSKKGVMVIEKNPVYQRVADVDPDMAKLMVGVGQPKSQLGFSDLHNLQATVGQALRRAEKDANAPGSSMLDRRTRTELKKLYASLSRDVDAWAVKDPKAQAMLSDAKTFWRDRVVPGVINNKIYQRASEGFYGMSPRGYTGANQLYGDVVGKPQLMGDLYPYMSTEGRNLYDTLSTLPDMQARLISGTLPNPNVGPLQAAAGAIAGSPFQMTRALLSHIPGLQGVLQSPVAKQIHFSRDIFSGEPTSPLTRMAWGASQVPEERLEPKVRRVFGISTK